MRFERMGELNEYCGKKGLYAEQVKQWREQTEQAMSRGLHQR